VLSWDGRQEGYTISSRKGKGRAREQDNPEQTETQATRIRWDYEKAKEHLTKSGIMVERKDETLSGFLDGLRCVFSLGESEDGDPPEQGYRDRPRFIVLHNAERIAPLEHLPVGQSEGTLLACFMRLGELVSEYTAEDSLQLTMCFAQTGKPIVPILVSTQEWLTLRPQRGATEPAVSLDFPPLRQRDFLSFLPAYISPSLPISAAVADEQRQGLLTSLVDLVHQTFSPYFSSELEDYIYLVKRLWPAWVGKVESGQAQPGDTGRMVGLIRADLQAEISGLAELRPLILPSGNDSSTASVSRPPSPTKLNGTPTKQPPLPGFAASPNFYSPSVTPSKRPHSATASSSNANTASLAASLPLLSRYILISAFLASSNPSRKDIQMLATEDDDLFGGRKKKKGGGTRKTPQRKKLDVNGVARKEAIPQRLLGPKPFPVERLVAITECILPVEVRPLARSPDMLQQVRRLWLFSGCREVTDSVTSCR
jgi:origin recognition complex subunit 5